MAEQTRIIGSEKEHLRKLAEKKRSYSELPVMRERTNRWLTHNAGQRGTPMIVMESGPFADDVLPHPVCTSPLARMLERQLMLEIWNHECIDDDKVITPDIRIPWPISFKLFDLTINQHHAADGGGHSLGYSIAHPVQDLSYDLPKLAPSTFSVDRELAMAQTETAMAVFDGILDVRVENRSLRWVGLTAQAVTLMGMEAYLMAVMDAPDAVHRLMTRLRDDFMRFATWQEAEGLLTPNAGNDYAGAGSYGFSDELAGRIRTGEKVLLRDLWLNLNSQETLGISPSMYHEFVFPYYEEISRHFGLTYYGCCEPVHPIWDESVCHLNHLRKVSISPWCDEAYMGKALAGKTVVYSRKPSPNFLGVGTFDADAFSRHISTTLAAARDCCVEFIFRDIYTLDGDDRKPGQAVATVRRLIAEQWETVEENECSGRGCGGTAGAFLRRSSSY